MSTPSSVPVKYLDDITECPICTQVFTDPRVLPCIHTFCLKCIETWGKQANTDHKLACPLCRKEIDIDEGKYGDLPKNFFVDKLLEVKKLSSALSQTEIVCDVCADEEESKVSTATVYCIDCQKNMCQTCGSWHQKFKFSTPHKVVDLASGQTKVELLTNIRENRCDKHPDKNLEIYCFDCKLPLCVLCYVTSHNSHKGSDVKQMAEEMSTQIKGDVEAVTNTVKEYQQLLEEVTSQQKELNEAVTKVEKQILERAEQMKQWVENCKLKLLEGLAAEKKKQDKQLQTLRHEVEDRLMMIESFKKYSDELRTKGTACDIAVAASGLHERAKELMKVSYECQSNVSENSSYSTNVKFASTSTIDELDRIFGTLEIGDICHSKFEEDITKSAQPANIIPGNRLFVTGLTTIGDELFVVRCGINQVMVHDVVTLSIKRQIAVSGSSAQAYFYDVVGCVANNCIYISDRGVSNIYRVDVTGNNNVTNWSVASSPRGLSLTNDRNVLVACQGANKLQEYTTHGTRVREISLQSDITEPLNAVQLSSGQFGITHRGWLHRYCVVGLDGKVIKSYGSSPGSGDGQLNDPHGLSVSKRGTVFIGDYGNNRVLMLDPVTFTARQLSVDGGLARPGRVHIDESRGRLYIGERGGKLRIVVMGK